MFEITGLVGPHKIPIAVIQHKKIGIPSLEDAVREVGKTLMGRTRRAHNQFDREIK